MSRVAKASIQLPADVEIMVEKDSVTIKGPKGSLNQHYNSLVDIEVTQDGERTVSFKPANNDINNTNAWAHAGTARALVNNMVHGVKEGYSKTLELVGTGFRAQANQKVLNLQLGFSHPINYSLPEGILAETPNNTTIILKGLDKQRIGQIAAEIRAFRPPEPYKGKGIRFAGQIIIRKEAKKK